MWKKINKILHDKNDYHLDPSLQRDVEVSDELLQATIKYQKNLIPRKIKYFFENDKFFFVRLLSKYLLKFVIGITVIGIIILTIFLAFGIDINFQKAIKPDYSKAPIYIPSTGYADKDADMIQFYKKKYSRNATYIIFYTKDPSKNYEKWKSNISGLESANYPNPYEARREGSEYWGKYQLGNSARKSIKMSQYSWEEWKSNPQLQEAAMRFWVDALYKDLKPWIKKYDGKFLNGWSITESGIIAMSHNTGPEPIKKWLDNGCYGTVPTDGSGRDATRFLILGNYDLEITK